MIIVVGRPGLDENDQLDRLTGRISRAISDAGGRVEVVGSVGDDLDGERVALALGQAGVGHAALLRDPAGVSPRLGGPGGPLPRLDDGDVELGLNYLVECRVLILAEPVDEKVRRVAADAAAYHGAHLIAVVEPGSDAATGAGEATVLEQPEGEGAFAALVARYAVALVGGGDAAEAWQSAVRAVGWERVDDEDAD